jgi:hypothetical protein
MKLPGGSSIGWHAALITWTLALLRRFRGAKLGANVHQHQATSGDVQRFSLRSVPTSGDTGRCQAALGKCLLSSRSRVRVALGAQVCR